MLESLPFQGNKMNISIDYNTYKEYKPFFDLMANALKKDGHRVGIITGLREVNPINNVDFKNQEVIPSLGFVADFIHMWGKDETIANGSLWKCQKMDQENVTVHFDEDARELKRYTERWIFKSLNPSDLVKF